jgi:hypothetical protein
MLPNSMRTTEVDTARERQEAEGEGSRLLPLREGEVGGGDKVREKFNERAQVEGSIGAVKSARRVQSATGTLAEVMGVCGQRSVLGLNLNKLIRGLAARRQVVLVG